MVKAHAPRWFRGDSWALSALAVALTFAVPAASFAQDTKKAEASKTDPAKAAPKNSDPLLGGNDPAGAANDIAAKPEGQGVINNQDMKKQESVELFKDPRSEKANTGNFPEIPYPASRALSTIEVSSLRNMAAALSAPDRTLITKAVDIQVAEMTSRANIRFVIDPPPTKPGAAVSSQFRAIEKASQLLIELYGTAKEKKNEPFLQVYVPILVQKLTPLLSNHLIPRLQAAIILGKVGNATMLDLFIKQIADSSQSVWVKQWAAIGISNATNDGTTTLDVVKATNATAALVAYLQAEPKSPWPVKVRVIEAIGNLRLPSIASPPQKPLAVAALVENLANTQNKLEVRAWSAWSIGLVQMTPSQQFNFTIEAYHIGRLAAELGEKVGYEYDQNEKLFAKRSDYARYLTGLLLYQVSPSLGGEQMVQNSGLLNMRHPGIAPAKKFMTELDDQIKNVIQEAVDLLRAGGAELPGIREKLGKRVAELNAFLDKNRPENVELYPGGPKFPAPAAPTEEKEQPAAPAATTKKSAPPAKAK